METHGQQGNVEMRPYTKEARSLWGEVELLGSATLLHTE